MARSPHPGQSCVSLGCGPHLSNASQTVSLELNSTAVIRPGDTLIVAVDNTDLTRERIEEYADHIKRGLGDEVKVMVVVANHLAVYRPEATP